jgi:predicted  nucleic acid-binding Zn-ribbon protein
MHEDLHRVVRLVEALARRERRLLLVRVSLRALRLALGLVFFALVAGPLGVDKPAAAAVLVLVAGIGAWSSVVVPLRRFWRAAGDRLRQARRIEELRPGLRGRMVVAVSRAADQGAGESDVMLARVARKAMEGVSDLAPGEVHPVGFLRTSVSLTALSAAAVVVTLGWVGPSRAADWWWGPDASVAAAAAAHRDVREETASVGDLSLRYVYPEYTGLEPYEVRNSTGEAHGPPGTVVHVTARVADVVEAAAVEAYQDPAADAAVDPSGRVLSGSFTIRPEPGSWNLVTYRGGVSLPSERFPIVPEADLAPEVMLSGPEGRIEVAVDEAFELAWQAADDFGLVKVEIHVDEEARGRVLASPRERSVELRDTVRVRPADLGLRAGDRVDLSVAAWDNDAVSGSKVGRSRVVQVQVLGASGLAQRDDGRRRKLLNMMVDVLAAHLEEEFPPGDSQGEVASWGEGLVGRYAPLDALVDEAGRSLEGSIDGAALAAVARTARELIRYTQVAYLPGSAKSPSDDALMMTGRLREAAIVALEDGIIALDLTLQVAAQRVVTEQAKDLRMAAQNLAEELAEGAEAAELLARLDTLERMLHKVRENAARMAEGSLREFINARADLADGLIADIRAAIQAGDLDEARELMERLGTAVEELAKGVEDNLARQQQEESDLQEAAESLEKELEALEKDQRALQEQVAAVRERSDAQAAEQIEDRWAELERRVDRLQELGGAYASGLVKFDRSFGERERAADAVEIGARLDGAVARKDLSGSRRAHEEAGRAWDGVDGLREFETMRRDGPPPGPGLSQMTAIVNELAAIGELLDDQARAAQSVTAETRQQVQQMREQQQAIEQRLGAARSAAKQIAESMPIRPDGLEEALEDAQAEAGQAGTALEKGAPMPAEGSMGSAAQRIGDAADALKDAMQSLQQMQQGGESSGERSGGQQQEGDEGQGGDPDSGGKGMSVDNMRVEIPGAEEYVVPEEYRKALLEGMQGDVPEEYRALKKRYFEELVHQ